jgi:TonB-linked SusC/RagA family outer membrane protein
MLRRVPAGPRTVRVLRIGYAGVTRTLTVSANDTAVVNVTLRQVAVELPEVVATGYGTQSRREVSTAVSTVTNDQIANNPVASVDAALQGKAPGIQVIENAGNPGNGITVRVRGSASLSATNQPLYVIDGVPMLTESYSQLSMGGQDITAVSGLSPDEIASIDILKDAAAAAIYGSRASNGVVMITTKRGQAGARPRVTFNTYAGTQAVNKKLGLLNARQYVDYFYEAYINDCMNTPSTCGQKSPPTRQRAEQLAEGDLGYSRRLPDTVNTDWQGAVLQTAPVSDLSLQVSGGTDRVQYLVSGANFDQQGIAIGSAYNRQNARANLDFRASERLAFRSSIGLSRENHTRNENDNTISGVVTNGIAEQPIFPVRQPNGGYTSPNDGLEYTNPVAIGRLDNAESRGFRGLGSLEGEYSFNDEFKWTSHIGMDILNLRDLRWSSPQVLGTYAASVQGQAQQGYTTATRYLAESFLNYDRGLGAGRLTLSGGGSVEYNSTESNWLQGERFGNEAFRYPGNAGIITDYAGGKTGYNLVSFFSRANLALEDRYFLTGSFRTDGSSHFGKNNQYGVFPAVSLGWLVSDEPFFGGLHRLGSLKVRASYGVTGNQGISDNFAPLPRFGKANYGDIPGIAPTAIGNPNLKWETTREVDLGFDLGVLGERVSLVGDWYRKKTNDLLVLRPITYTSGFSSFWDNIGNIENHGLELGVTTVNVQPSSVGGLRWETDLNISWNKNKVTKLYQGQPFNAGTYSINRVEEGQPLGAFYTVRFAGVDPQTGDAIYLDKDGVPHKYSDRTPTTADRVIVGSPHPNYFGGFTNGLSWKGFDLRAFLQFSQGNKVFNAMRVFSNDGGYYNDNKFTLALNRWQKPGDKTNEPRASWNGLSGARVTSSRYIEDGSYIRFQELTLGYHLPVRLAQVGNLQDARLFVSGRNLHTWTKYSGYNPDVNSNGVTANISLGTDFYAYPLSRTLMVGISGGW